MINNFAFISTKDIFTLKACKMHNVFLKSLISNIARASYNVFYDPFQKEKVYFMALQSENIYFRSWAVWQNENHSVVDKPQTSKQEK